MKSNLESVRLRTMGNKWFCRSEFDAALDSYSAAIRYAVCIDDADIVVNGDNDKEQFESKHNNQIPLNNDDVQALALAFGNRSAVLFEIGAYRDCLTDVQRALKFASVLTKKTRLRLEARRKLSISASACQSDSNAAVDSKKQQSPTPTTSTKLFNGAHESIACLSSAVSLKYSTEKGRHLIATKPIPAGSVCVLEQPYCCVLLKHAAHSRCYACYRRLPLSSLPCHRCTEELVSYCNEQCRKVAWNRYHKWECGHVERLVDLGISHLALRILLCTKPCDLADSFSKIALLDGVYGSESCEVGTNPTNPFLAVCGLQSHLSSLSPSELSTYRDAASGLVRFLQLRQFPYSQLSESQMHEVLVGFIARLICNAHAVQACETSSCSDGLTEDQSEERIASGVYPTTSLLNHSCRPNCFTSFIDGNMIVVRCTVDLQPGDELFNCYGPEMGRQCRVERQSALRDQYRFECKCVACCSDDCAEIEREMQAAKCENCDAAVALDLVLTANQQHLVACQQCGKRFSVHHLSDVSSTTADMEQFLTTRSMNISETQWKLLLTRAENCLHENNKLLVEFRDYCAVWATHHGDVKRAVELLTQNLSALQRWHGCESLKCAREMLKIVQLQKLIGDEPCEMERKSRNIVRIYYGCEYACD